MKPDKLTQDTRELLRLAMPLMELLKRNYHPHTQIEVTETTVKITEDIICAKNT